MNIHPKTKYAYDLLHEGTLALARAEQQGLRINMDYCEKKKAHLTRKIERMERLFKETNFFKHWQHTVKSPVNINSNLQLSNFLYKIKKLEPAYSTTSGQGSTDEDALKQLNIPELNDLLEIRKLKKVRDTYLDAFMREQVDGYIHPSFNLHLVVSYRSSSDRPNFQNNPKRDEESMRIVRSAIYPRPGHQLMEVDYSGIEVRINACINQDKTLVNYMRDPTSDMHRDMAIQIFKLDHFAKGATGHKVLRQATKNGFVFPEFYGDYYKNCAENMACVWGGLSKERWKPGQGIPLEDPMSVKNGLEGIYINLSDQLISKGIKTFDQFTNHLKDIEQDFWNNRFPEYRSWKDRWYWDYQKCGYIDLLSGFRCQGQMDRKQVCNYPGQGTAFHCLLWSFNRVDKTLREGGWDSRLVGQIHDSMLFDAHPDEVERLAKVVQQITCHDLPQFWPWIIVPMEVEMELAGIDKSWAELKPYVFSK